MRWVEDKDCQLWDQRAVQRNTIYDKSYKEPRTMEEVTMPVKNKLTIRRVKKTLRKLKRTLRIMKKNKQEALLSKQFHSLEMK